MPAPAEVGSTANNYEILAKLAAGGMAEIFLARGESAAGVERYVVLKRILRERASDVHFVKMFLDEARLATLLQHPNIAQVHDIGRLGDSYFFTMEYVHGETVRAVLHRAHAEKKPVPIGCAMTMIAGVAQGLHHAHERIGLDGKPLGIVHRDVSLSNLMVSYEGHVKVVDFGVAKAAHTQSETRTGTLKGKIGYLSPEQCRGSVIDRRADLFSLGIVFWELLATDRLFKRGSDFESMTAIVNEAVPPPSSKRADVPPELDGIVARLLAKSADDRFQTAEELVEALEKVATSARISLSTSALGRYVRELFGAKPEPWIAMSTSTAAPPEGVTMTSQPIPDELAIAHEGSVDLALHALPDLSAMHADDDSDSEGKALPDLTPVPVVSASARASISSRASQPRIPVARPTPTSSPALPVPAPVPAAPAAAAAVAEVRVDRRRTPWTPLIASVLLLGAASVAIAAIATHHDDTPIAIAAPPAPPPAPPIAAPSVIVPVLVGPGSSAPTPTPSPSANTALPSMADATAAATVDDAIARCLAWHGALPTSAIGACTVAACTTHHAAEARKWAPALDATARTSVASACTKSGVALAQRAPTASATRPHPATNTARPASNCVADPLSCQH